MIGVLHGNCLDILRASPAHEVDAVVTDPPYGLGFMGAAWDHRVPGVEFWREFLRVSKPGAFLVACGGTRTWHRQACAIEDAGWEITDSLAWLYGTGYPKSRSGLKPAHEPIVLARAPGPVRELNIDACRTPAERKGNHTKKTARDQTRESTDALSMSAGDPCDGLGRWPANVVLDEIAGAILDEQTGILTSARAYSATLETSVALGAKKRNLDESKVFSDSGGASRYFYCPKASRAERTHAGEVANKHPTVKPIALMRWLLRLVTPPGGLVLDPFCGSGTTLLAARDEGFSCVGIDNDPNSVRITEERLAA